LLSSAKYLTRKGPPGGNDPDWTTVVKHGNIKNERSDQYLSSIHHVPNCHTHNKID